MIHTDGIQTIANAPRTIRWGDWAAGILHETSGVDDGGYWIINSEGRREYVRLYVSGQQGE